MSVRPRVGDLATILRLDRLVVMVLAFVLLLAHKREASGAKEFEVGSYPQRDRRAASRIVRPRGDLPRRCEQETTTPLQRPGNAVDNFLLRGARQEEHQAPGQDAVELTSEQC